MREIGNTCIIEFNPMGTVSTNFRMGHDGSGFAGDTAKVSHSPVAFYIVDRSAAKKGQDVIARWTDSEMVKMVMVYSSTGKVFTKDRSL